MRARIAEIAGDRRRSRRGEGDDQREARLHRPPRRHRRHRHRDRAPAVERAVIDEADRARRRRLLDACRKPAAEDRDGGILHRRAGRRRADRHRRLSDVVDRGFVTYTNDAKQTDARRAGGDADDARRGQPRDRRGHGPRRAGPFRRRSCGRRSPALPARAAVRRTSRSDSCISPRPRATAACVHREQRFGDIGRHKVRLQIGGRGARDAARTGGRTQA